MGRGYRMSHSAVLRSELGEGMNHLMRAAGHAPGAMMESAGPAWRMASGRMRSPGMSRMRPMGMRGRALRMRPMGMRGWALRMRPMGMRGWALSRGMRTARHLSMKVAAMAPLAAVARAGGARMNRRANRGMTKMLTKKGAKSGGRRGMLVGLLAAGTAVGAAAALAARRRNRMAWEEYETHPHEYSTDAATPMAQTPGSTATG